MTYNRLNGEALRNLRLLKRLSLQSVADAIKSKTGEGSKQSASLWEKGKVDLTEVHINNYLRAIGSDKTELEREIERLASAQGATVERPQQSWTDHYPIALNIMDVDNEDLSPWAKQGETVLYDCVKRPKAGEGCVVELTDGTRILRIYEGTRDGHIFLKTLNPDKLENFLITKINNLYKIHLRG